MIAVNAEGGVTSINQTKTSLKPDYMYLRFEPKRPPEEFLPGVERRRLPVEYMYLIRGKPAEPATSSPGPGPAYYWTGRGLG